MSIVHCLEISVSLDTVEGSWVGTMNVGVGKTMPRQSRSGHLSNGAHVCMLVSMHTRVHAYSHM